MVSGKILDKYSSGRPKRKIAPVTLIKKNSGEQYTANSIDSWNLAFECWRGYQLNSDAQSIS